MVDGLGWRGGWLERGRLGVGWKVGGWLEGGLEGVGCWLEGAWLKGLERGIVSLEVEEGLGLAGGGAGGGLGWRGLVHKHENMRI